MIELYVLHNDKIKEAQVRINLDKLSNNEITERQEILQVLHSTMMGFAISKRNSYNYLF